MLDDFDLDFPEDEEEEISGARPNRTFLMVAGGLGALIVISLICVVGYMLLGGQDGDEAAQAQSQTQTAIAANAAANQAASQTALAQIPTNTLPPPPTATTAPPTSTEPSIPTVTSGFGPTADPRTATVQALLTQAAQAQTQAAAELLTASPTTTALPDTGFADDIGAPALLGLAGVLILVIFIARRLREAPA